MKKLFNVTVGGYYLCSLVLGIMMALTIGMIACDMWDYGFSQYLVAEKTVTREYPDGGFTMHNAVDVERYSIDYDTEIFYPKGDVQTKTAWTELKRRYDNLWETERYLPMADLWDATNVYYKYGMDGYFIQYGEFCLITVAVITLVLSVLIMEGKSANKVWRQKMLQAFGIAIFIVLIDMARRCAWYRVYSRTSATPITMLLPVVFLIIPLIILKKTRQPNRVKEEAGAVNPNVHKEIVIPSGASDETL